LRTDKIANTQR